MAMKITEDCTACDACFTVCPNDAIATGDPYTINPKLCTECVGVEEEPQCVLECYEECVVEDPDWVESEEVLQAKYDSLHPTANPH